MNANRTIAQSLAVASAALALVLPTLVRAQVPPPGYGPPPGGGPEGPGGGAFGPGRIERMVHELGLSPDQMQKVRAAVNEFHHQRIRLRAQIEEARLSLREYLGRAEGVTIEHARDMVTAIGQFETQLHQARVALLLRLRGILNPAQWQRALEMFEERFGGHGPQEGRFGPGPARRGHRWGTLGWGG